MKNRRSGQTPVRLTVHMEGKGVQQHRIALQDLILFGHQLQTALGRIGTVLSGGASLKRGRKPAEIAEACSLDLVSMTGGSVALAFEPRRQSPEQLEFFPDAGNLGERALESLVGGLAYLGSGAPETELPSGYDRGVLLAVREGGKILDHGISAIRFDLRARSQRLSASYTPELQERVVRTIRGPVAAQRTVEGRLLMGDFRESDLRCRVHPPAGAPIACTFDETQRESVLAALTRYVRIVGESKEESGRIVSLKIADIEIVDRRGEAEEERPLFDEKSDLDRLAAEQDVTAVADFDSLLGDFWPEDESADDFIAQVRSWRREDALKREL
jgi:hypothetical protein